MDIWEQIVLNDLNRYSYLGTTIKSLQDKIFGLTVRMESGSSTLSTTPVSGGHTPLEDKYVNNLALKDKYEIQLKSNILEYKAITRAIKSLSPQDHAFLTWHT